MVLKLSPNPLMYGTIMWMLLACYGCLLPMVMIFIAEPLVVFNP